MFLGQYLVYTNSAGYFLAASGGLDSYTSVLIVFRMARLALESVKCRDKRTLTDLRRVTGEETSFPALHRKSSHAFFTLVT